MAEAKTNKIDAGALGTTEDNTLEDQWGNKREIDTEKYPDDSPAHQGVHTPPSGRGGMSPKARPDHQDMFPANPEPSEHAKKRGEENAKVARGEVSPVNPEGTEPDFLKDISNEDVKPGRSTNTTRETTK
jgi:hypothetical protein